MTRMLKAGFIEVPGYLFSKIREGYQTRRGRDEAQRKGVSELNRSHVERRNHATTIVLQVLQNIRKDVR